MRPRRGVNELPADAHSASRFADATFEDITHPQFTADLLHVHGSPLVGEAGIAGDDEQLTETRQSRNDFFDHAIGKVLLLTVATQVLEWKYGNGGFCW